MLPSFHRVIALPLLAFALAFTSCQKSKPHRLEPVSKANLPWLTDLSEGRAKANAERKPLLVSIGGSDWCVWCQQLAKEVFVTPKFEEFAKRRLILVDIDLPQFEELPPGELERRQAVAQKLKVDQYPTVIVYSADNNELARLTYMPGGPDVFIGELERLIGK